MSDKELLERTLAILLGVDQKLRTVKARIADEYLNSAWSDVAGLAMMVRSHLGNAEFSEEEQHE
jgi:hypothetical protein